MKCLPPGQAFSWKWLILVTFRRPDHPRPRATRGGPSGSDCSGGTKGLTQEPSLPSDSGGSRSGQGGFAPRSRRFALLAHALARPGTRERGAAHQTLAALLLVDALGFRLSRFCALTHKSILSESVPRSTASVAAQRCFKSMTSCLTPLLRNFLTHDAVPDGKSSDPTTVCPLILLIIVEINRNLFCKMRC